MCTVVHAGIYPHPPILISEVGGGETTKVAATVKPAFPEYCNDENTLRADK